MDFTTSNSEDDLKIYPSLRNNNCRYLVTSLYSMYVSNIISQAHCHNLPATSDRRMECGRANPS